MWILANSDDTSSYMYKKWLPLEQVEGGMRYMQCGDVSTNPSYCLQGRNVHLRFSCGFQLSVTFSFVVTPFGFHFLISNPCISFTYLFLTAWISDLRDCCALWTISGSLFHPVVVPELYKYLQFYQILHFSYIWSANIHPCNILVCWWSLSGEWFESLPDRPFPVCPSPRTSHSSMSGSFFFFFKTKLNYSNKKLLHKHCQGLNYV